MRSKDSQIINNVADAARKIMLGEEPDSQEFDQELKKTQTKASKKKTPEEEAGVSKALVQAVKVEDVNVFDLPLDTMSEEDVASLKSLTQEAMDAVPLSQEQSSLIDKINVIREKYNMTLLQSLNNKKQIGEDKKELKKISKELAGASKMHKSQSERIEKLLPDVKSVDEAHGELHGGQKKLDMNKNNKVDAEDFKMLRAKKKPAKRVVHSDKPDSLVSMRVSKEAVEYVNEVEVLPKGVTRHKAKLAQGAKYGASDYGRGGEEEQEVKKAMTRKTEPKKRGSYGARQNIVRGTRVSGKDVNESASFFDKLTLLEEAPLEAISLSLQEGRMKDMVTHHMDAGHSYDSAVKKAEHDAANMPIEKLRKKYGLPTPKKQMSEGKLKDIITGHMTTGKGMSYDDAVKKAQADMNKMKKPKQMSSPLSKQKANEEYEQLDEKKHKKKHSCAEKVKSEEYGIGYCIPEMHTMLEDGTVTHYDVEFEDCIVENYPVSELKILKEAMHEHYDNEEKNQLHELSPKTLGSYAKKAQRQTMNTNMAIGANPSDNPVTRREKAFAKKRKEGASRAIGKLVQKKMSNEEYEQLDELSPKTLGSYAQKSVRDLEKRDKAMGKATQRDREVVDPETSKPFQKMAKRRSGLTKAINRLSKEDILAAAYDEIEQIEEGTPTKKQVKQGIGIARDKRYAKGNMSGAVKAMDKVNKGLAQHPAVAKELRKQNEDIEQIDELDTKTLMSYRDKAEDDQVDRAMDMKGNTPKAKKRAMGIEKAKGRLQMKAQLYGGRPGQSSYKGGHLNPVKKEEVELTEGLPKFGEAKQGYSFIATKTHDDKNHTKHDVHMVHTMLGLGHSLADREKSTTRERIGHIVKDKKTGQHIATATHKDFKTGKRLNNKMKPVDRHHDARAALQQSYFRGSFFEEVEYIVEKNVPNNPKLWSRAKSLAKQKFDVYPSAYANGWASKWYKSKGGSWRKG
jgi:hypothetical protein